jgi:hypothetical protein
MYSPYSKIILSDMFKLQITTDGSNIEIPLTNFLRIFGRFSLMILAMSRKDTTPASFTPINLSPFASGCSLRGHVNQRYLAHPPR